MRKSQGLGARSLFGADRLPKFEIFVRPRYRRLLIILATLALPVAALWWGCSDDIPVAPSGRQEPVGYIAEPGLRLGPIEGITTAWHVAPREFAVPLGVDVQLRCPAPSTAQIRWTGAVEIERDAAGSTASCPTSNLGTHRVEVEVILPPPGKEGDPRKPRETVDAQIYACEFEVVSVSVSFIRVSQVRASRQPLYVSQSASNWELLKHYQSGSIAAVREVSPARYVTAVATLMELTAHVEPAVFGALVEWRVDGEAVMLGEYGEYAIEHPGRHTVEAGPAGTDASLIIDAYRVVALEPTNFSGNGIPDDTPASFVARTEPEGFEHFVTWLAATQFGRADPVTGQGEGFTVTFSGTTDHEDAGNLDRWVGIRADNATFNQDGPSTGSIELAVVDSLGGPYAGVLIRLEEPVGVEGTTNGQGVVTFNNVPNGSIDVTLIATVTVANPGGDPIIIEMEANNVINAIVTGGVTTELDLICVVDAPQQKPGCGSVPTTMIVLAKRADGYFGVNMQAGVNGPCPCEANFTAPLGVPPSGGCPRVVSMVLTSKPPAQLWSVVCSTCLGGQNCEQPIATSTAAEYQ